MEVNEIEDFTVGMELQRLRNYIVVKIFAQAKHNILILSISFVWLPLIGITTLLCITIKERKCLQNRFRLEF